MKTATLDQITSQGEVYLATLHAGDAVTILQNGKAVALLIGVTPKGSAPRPLGCYAGQIQVGSDFNDPLPEFDQAIESPL